MAERKETAAPPVDKEKEEKDKKFEMRCGVLIAAFAAVLAVADIGAGKYGDDELIAHSEKADAYQWFNTKGIKETIKEGRLDELRSKLQAGEIAPDKIDWAEDHIRYLEDEIKRYKKEKTEILLGSAAVGKENWVQEKDGEMGKIIGAKEWEAKANALGEVGDIFDFANFFLQLCLVMGAVSLVLDQEKLKQFFFTCMLVLGSIGALFAGYAFASAFAI